jgi:hypothetical protein
MPASFVRLSDARPISLLVCSPQAYQAKKRRKGSLSIVKAVKAFVISRVGYELCFDAQNAFCYNRAARILGLILNYLSYIRVIPSF